MRRDTSVLVPTLNLPIIAGVYDVCSRRLDEHAVGCPRRLWAGQLAT